MEKFNKIYVEVIRKHKICIYGTQSDIDKIKAKDKEIIKEMDCYADLFESPPYEVEDVKIQRLEDNNKTAEELLDDYDAILTDDAERIIYREKTNENKENNS